IVSEIRARFESTAPSLGLGDRLHIEERTGRVDTLLSEYARVFDMLVIGRNATEDVDEHLVLHPDRIALLSGRPILIVPEHHTGPARHDRAVIAWDGGRAAARALSDSLALLEDQGSVTVLTIGDISPAIPASAVRRHLERHSIDAKVEHIDADPGVARALVAYCKSQQPGLLVMGAYEHSKFREDFMGGVTARVLQTVPVPVLMSH
ncbi:MAG: universal stress protein, partial [Pseudomonadota bacterium]